MFPIVKEVWLFLLFNGFVISLYRNDGNFLP